MNTARVTSNPYPGPTPFEREQESLFFGRDREVDDLFSLLTAHPVVVLNAPSGAGKTSLLNAGLIPLLSREGFEVLPVARVRGFEPQGMDLSGVANLYAFNTLLSWAR
ncbi:MAG: ATP-binding protein, partial [Syntrophobacteraceae bacterium]|nr:ATP-binding protein [Syntrophobacteraceae bacterium]